MELTYDKVYSALREVCIPQDVIGVMDALTGTTVDNQSWDFPDQEEKDQAVESETEETQEAPPAETEETPPPPAETKEAPPAETEETPPPAEVTSDDVREAINAYAAACKPLGVNPMEKAVAIFSNYGATKLGEIKPSFFVDVIEDFADATKALN